MTSSNHNNDLVTSQKKLEWVTPKISLWVAEETDGKPFDASEGTRLDGAFGPTGLS